MAHSKKTTTGEDNLQCNQSGKRSGKGCQIRLGGHGPGGGGEVCLTTTRRGSRVGLGRRLLSGSSRIDPAPSWRRAVELGGQKCIQRSWRRAKKQLRGTDYKKAIRVFLIENGGDKAGGYDGCLFKLASGPMGGNVIWCTVCTQLFSESFLYWTIPQEMEPLEVIPIGG